MEYIQSKGISKYEFYKKSGITRSVLDKESGISEDNIAKVIRYDPHISLSWLIKGEGPMLLSVEAMVQEPTAGYGSPDQNDYSKPIPLYELETLKKAVALFDKKRKPRPVDYVCIPGLSECDGATFVTDTSMQPLLKKHDIVVYKKTEHKAADILWGSMYLVGAAFDGKEELSVKWIQKSDKGNAYIKLVAENKQHKPVDIPLSKVTALALVKASIHNH